jgi:hypothetical protein
MKMNMACCLLAVALAATAVAAGTDGQTYREHQSQRGAPVASIG